MTKTAFYPGSFDPPTLGHVDLIRRGARVFDRLVIGIGVHPGKKPVFSIDEKIAMLQKICVETMQVRQSSLDIITFDNLTVEAAQTCEASVILRGLRNGSDFDYENQLAGMNQKLAKDIETVFLTASPQYRHINATLVRQIASMGGDVSSFVPRSLVKEITEKFLET